MTSILQSGVSCVLVALFLAGGVGEAVGLHECPHHHATAVEAGHGPGSHGASDEGHGDDGGACSCLGTCQGATSVALPIGAGDVRLDLGDVTRELSTSTGSPDLESTPYLLPFATGPPTS